MTGPEESFQAHTAGTDETREVKGGPIIPAKKKNRGHYFVTREEARRKE